MSKMDQYEVVVGLEVHAQLLTRTKLFCGDTTAFGQEPNTQISVVSLGYPGTLPRLNREAVTLAVKLGLACNCEIVQHNYFARKNYFYADLPKGYQISQHTTPVCKAGYLDIQTARETKRIRINRIHIEEDAGKSMHGENDRFSNLDFNRAGMPLLEIVTEPDLRSAEEAFAYVTLLRKLVRHLGVCDGNMEQGSLRCDVNISVRKKGEERLGTKVEIKNLNSIRFIRKAIEFESHRLIGLVEEGRPVLQETRGFNETDFSTYSIRVKEDEDDYRYFPEPDLPPFYITDDMIAEIRSAMPAMQSEIRDRLVNEYQLSPYDAGQLSNDTELSQFFFELAAHTANFKAAANWVLGPVKQQLSTGEETVLPVQSVAQLIGHIDEGKISYGIAVQKIVPALLQDPSLDISRYIVDNGLQIETSQTEIESLIEAALSKHQEKINEYKKGKKGLISLFVGEVMRLSKGKADARMVTEKIIEKLKS